MNIILFEDHEIGRPLPRRDPRTIHLIKVLHKKAGDTFDAGLLGGSRGQGRIEALRLDGAIFFSLDLWESPPPRLPIRLGVGFPRPIQLRRLLRDLSNLGVAAVDLVGTDLGEKSYRETKLLTDGGARSALIEGAVQARDTALPELSVYPSLEAWFTERPWAALRPGPLLVAADNVRPEGSLARLPSLRRSLVLAIGPERGWSDRERTLLEEEGFSRLSLGSRALRTETACTAAVILAMEKIGELG
ncbi:MAG: 16S rRNA (uracil(1498)-N(3))-methyltransferase [Spirochaetaceae bacterium]|jgi:RsmE family RNA methyltransferase|nr:16S rRNA (uracil(1498)-N(3))-methyltransferase [Spirochaetaceae bacterium]